MKSEFDQVLTHFSSPILAQCSIVLYLLKISGNLLFSNVVKLCILQTRIGFPHKFSLRVILLHTLGKYIKNETKFNKRLYAKNKIAASDECLKVLELMG